MICQRCKQECPRTSNHHRGNTMTTEKKYYTTGVYTGTGFFVQPNGTWAFVNKRNREASPTRLIEGHTYTLSAEPVLGGVKYHVEGEVGG